VRARLIVNPTSGADRAPELLPLVTERLRALVTDLDVTTTTGEADIARAAAGAAEDRREMLFIAGGDGTVNIAVRAVSGVAGGLERTAFGIIPAGTGNDFAKALGLGEAAEPALDLLLDARVIDVDLGVMNDRPFVNASAGGFVADVSAVLTEPLKDATGKLAYIIGGARALLGREPFSTHVAVPAGQPYSAPLELQMFAVCNARMIGGGYPMAPAALIDDGELDVFLVKRTPTIEFLALLQKIAAGEHAQDDRILHFRAAALELVFDRLVNVNIDGEVLQADRCRYQVRRRAARFLCGPRPHATAHPRPLMV
jgi:diacylglycerol kinase (ATP)